MRFVLLFFLIQLVVPAFAEVDTAESTDFKKASYHTQHHDSNIIYSVLLKENAEENESDNKTPILSAELIDFTFLTTVLTQYHSRSDWDGSNTRAIHEPLFKLHCNFLI